MNDIDELKKKSWLFENLSKIRRNARLDGKELLGMVELGLVFIEESTETVLPSYEGNELYKTVISELNNGKLFYSTPKDVSKK